ncbi:MAG: AAA family ATPase [Gemmatimonadota bacterium]
MPAVPPFQLITLGRLALLDHEGRDLLPRDVAKPLALLAYLAAAPGRRCSRERLVDLFWGDSALEQGRASLRQVVYRLREVLGDAALANDGTDLRLTQELHTDRDSFLCALEQGQLEPALALYQGAYVTQFVSRGTSQFEQWRDQEQDRLHDLFTNTVDVAGERALAAGHAAEASALARRVLDDYPLDERGWRLRLQAEQLAGSSIHLAASIAELRRRFAAEGWQPQPRTLQLVASLEQIRRSSHDASGGVLLEADLVGRGAVMAAMYEQWKGVARHGGAHIHLVGGAGLGKSRVLDDFAVRLKSERGRVAVVGAYPRQHFVPGAMLAAAISSLAELSGTGGITPESARILIDLQPTVSARFPAAAAPTSSPARASDPIAGEAIHDLLDNASHNGPVCLIFDDAHWWDDLSRRVIEAAIERLGERPILVVTASRPGASEISTGLGHERIELLRWTDAEVGTLLQSIGRIDESEVTITVASALCVAAEGVPLLVLEAIRLGLDRALISLRDQRWHFEHLNDFLTLLRPGQLLRERASTLTPRQRHLLLMVWLLESEVTESEHATIDPDASHAMLPELERLGFLSSSACGWKIAHDAIGEAIENTADHAALRAAHRDAGRLVLQRGDQPALLLQVAKHAIESGDHALQHEVALRWLRYRRAGRATDSAPRLLTEVFPPEVPSSAIRALTRNLPGDLRRRPWSARRLAPIWAVAGAAVALAAFTVFERTPIPDATLGVYGVAASGRPVDHRLALRHDGWGTPAGFTISSRSDKELAPWGSTPAESLSNGPIGDPSGERWIFARTRSDSNGPTELVLQSGATERVIASAPGDDALSAWSPDGRFVVFQSNRWTTGPSANFDLSIVDLTSNHVRRLTADAADEVTPSWSPDGSRIAYVKRSALAAGDSVCWIGVDGRRGVCRSVSDRAIGAVLGWLDAATVVVAAGSGTRCQLPALNLDSGIIDHPLPQGQCNATLSPDGSWLAWPLTNGTNPGPSRVAISSITGVAKTTEIALPTNSTGEMATYWQGPWRTHWLAQVRVRHQGDTVNVGSNYQLELRGEDQAGAAVAIPPAVVSWRSEDTTVAQVDSNGMVHPLRTGAVTIHGSAGGWRAGEVHLIIVELAPTVVYTEEWSGDWAARWHLYGDPTPVTVPSAPGRPAAFLVNGDGVYSSSGASSRRFDPRPGVALDVRLTTPITQSKWQVIRVGLSAVTGASRGGLTGKGSCTFAYPSGEGWEARTQAISPAGVVVVGNTLRSGDWYDVRVQIFPDGTCGMAINGIPVGRSETAVAPRDSVAVSIEGQTVGSQLLVGPLKVWSGVPGDIDWSKLPPNPKPR